MPQYSAYTLNGNTLAQSQCCEPMPGAMEGNFLRNSTLFYHLFQWLTDVPIVEIREYEIVFLTGSVTLDNLQRSIQQFHLERHFCLVPFGQYPLLTIHFYDVAIG